MSFRQGPLTVTQAAALNKLRTDVDKLLQMRGVDPVNVSWQGGIPVIIPTPNQDIPVLVSGYSSGMGVSGLGVYWWHEETFNNQGLRVIKSGGGMFGRVSTSGQVYSGQTTTSGGTDILSGIPYNPLYETNNQVIPSSMFPYQGWARRRGQANIVSGPGKTMGQAYEFDFNLSGSAGGGGISGVNVIDASGVRVSGVVNLTLQRIDVTSGPLGAAQIIPRWATYDFTGMWGGTTSTSGTADVVQILAGGKQIVKTNPLVDTTTLILRNNSGGGISLDNSSVSILGSYPSGGPINNYDNLNITASSGGTALINWTGFTHDYSSGGTATIGESSIEMSSGLISSMYTSGGAAGGQLSVGLKITPPTLFDLSGGPLHPGVFPAGTGNVVGIAGYLGVQNSIQAGNGVIHIGTTDSRFTVVSSGFLYSGKTGVIGPFGTSVGGGIVGEVGSGLLAAIPEGVNIAGSSGTGVYGMIGIMWDPGTSRHYVTGYSPESGWMRILVSGW